MQFTNIFANSSCPAMSSRTRVHLPDYRAQMFEVWAFVFRQGTLVQPITTFTYSIPLGFGTLLSKQNTSKKPMRNTKMISTILY